MILQVGAHIAQHGNGAHTRQDSRGPIEQVLKVVSLQGVLELSVAQATADLHILHRLEGKRGSGDARQPGPQPVDHLIGTQLPFRERFQGDVERGLIRPGADVAGDHVHGGIALEDAYELAELLTHGLKRSVLRAQSLAAQAPGILLRKEALGNDHV